MLPADDVSIFTVEFESVFLYTKAGKKFVLLKKMEYLESVCDPNKFFRINRQMLVNKNAITSFEPYFNRKLILGLKVKTEEKPVVSRLRVAPFKAWLENLS
ncbi:MAG: LytTR family DNA-binding domain-containing protein [Bacteroidota bacterium]